MLLELAPEIREIAPEEWNPERLTAGALQMDALDMLRERFGLRQSAMEECLSDRERYRTSIDVYDDSTFCVVTLVDAANPLGPADKVAFFFKRNLFLMVTLIDADGSTERLFHKAVCRYRPEAVTLEKIIAAMLESLIDSDGEALANREFAVNALEMEIAQGNRERALNAEVFEQRRQLLRLRTFYEQLIDIGEELQENENDVFDGDTMRSLAMFTGKAVRLSANVQQLRDSLTQLREAYQALLDYDLNRGIRLLTVLATICLPPTLIAGWYGMNFRHMPELGWVWGYPLVIALSVLVVVIGLWYFRRKKML